MFPFGGESGLGLDVQGEDLLVGATGLTESLPSVDWPAALTACSSTVASEKGTPSKLPQNWESFAVRLIPVILPRLNPHDGCPDIRLLAVEALARERTGHGFRLLERTRGSAWVGMSARPEQSSASAQTGARWGRREGLREQARAHSARCSKFVLTVLPSPARIEVRPARPRESGGSEKTSDHHSLANNGFFNVSIVSLDRSFWGLTKHDAPSRQILAS